MVIGNAWQAWLVIALAAGAVSVWLVATTLQILPVGTAYAVWAGIGAVGTALVGLVFLGESADPLRLASITLVVVGIVGLQLSHG